MSKLEPPLQNIQDIINGIASQLDPLSRYVEELNYTLRNSKTVEDFFSKLEDEIKISKFRTDTSKKSYGVRGRSWLNHQIWKKMDIYDRIYSNLVTAETRLLWCWEPISDYQNLRHILNRLPKPGLILSAPCSIGKEAYSIAICSLIYNIKVSIVGVDKQQFYSEYASLGNITLNYKDWVLEESKPYMVKKNDNILEVLPIVLERCNFQVGDIIKNQLPSTKFSLVVCRNFLGYFRGKVLRTAIINISSKVLTGGFLLLDHYILNEPETKFINSFLSENGFVRVFKDSNFFIKE